mgnify:CR=1 FL=1
MNNNVISFDTGIEEFNLNGKVTVVFSPTDVHFVEKVLNALDDITSIYEKYQDEVSRLEDDEPSKEAAIAVYEIAHRADAEIREKINDAFGKDVCTPTIGDRSILMPANGLPVWENLLLAIIDKFDSQLVEEKAKTNPRLEAYTKKYRRNRKKR